MYEDLHRDHNGKMYDKRLAEGVLSNTELAGGYVAVIWFIKGDFF